MTASYPNRQKTLWEKEKLLVTSNFSFFLQCFQKACFPRTSKGVNVWEWVNDDNHTASNNIVTHDNSDTVFAENAIFFNVERQLE